MRTRNVSAVTSLGLGLLVAGALMAFLSAQSPLASPSRGGVITVCLDDGRCNHSSIQKAVDDANDGDLIKVAAGTYSDVHSRAAPDRYPYGEIVSQVVYLDKQVSIQGGYTVTNWITPNLDVNITKLDAGGRGRGLFIVDPSSGETITPFIVGLSITGGDASGLRGHLGYPDTDAGGGAYVLGSAVSISRSQIFGNVAHWGGGLYLSESSATLSGNRVFSNNAAHSCRTLYGGGLYLSASAAALVHNSIFSNTANAGAGLYLEASPAVLKRNVVMSNTARWYGGAVYLDRSDGAALIDNAVRGNTGQSGGGLYVRYSDAKLLGNTVVANTASGANGGGMYLERSTAVVSANLFMSNTASLHGGGLHLYRTDVLTLTNNVVADNAAGLSGSGLYLWRSAPRMLHTTIARNHGGDWSGVYVRNDGEPLWAVPLTNTILVSHRVGISVAPGGIITVNGMLWDSETITPISQYPMSTSVTVLKAIAGNPSFAPDGYHLLPGSAAIDEGVSSSVDIDIDGEPRPRGAAPDLGADEQGPVLFARFEHSAPHWLGEQTVFTNTTIVSGPVSYQWSFGDGASSRAVNPTYTYSSAGTYTVVLTATSGELQDMVSRRVVIYAASFTSSSPDWLGQTTVFTNTSVAGTAADHAWSFNDGTTSTHEHPTHTYQSPGLYAVTLTVTNEAGSGAAVGSVAVYGGPTVDFVALPRQGICPLDVAFTSIVSTTPPNDPSLRYLWHFAVGDESDSTSTLPTSHHTYATTGLYTVSLRVTNTLTSAVEVKPAYIDVRDGMKVHLPLVARDR